MATKGAASQGKPAPRWTLKLGTRQAIWAYIFLLVPLGFFLYFRIWPALQSFDLALRQWNIVAEERPFVGLSNFERLLNDERFWQSLRNTGLYTLVGVPAQLVLGIGIALLLERITILRGFFRSVYFIPYVTPVVAAAWVWQWLYSPNFGLLNAILEFLGLPAQGFLRDPSQALLSVTAMVVWQNLGFQVVIFLAGLQSISRTYYEAARIDGAGPLALFRHITLPLLNPTIVFSVVIATISFLQLFAEVVNLNFVDQGGPLGSTRTIVLHIYQLAFQRFQMGQAAAVTVVLFGLILLITLFQLKVLSKRVDY